MRICGLRVIFEKIIAMRKIACLLLFSLLLPASRILAQTPVTNQRLFDTIPFLPDFWPKRVALFESEPVEKGHIIFLGNSITQMGDWKKLLGDSSAINRGIGGDITFGVLKRLDDVIRRQPSKLFLLIGINDIGKDIPDAVIADNVKKIIRRVQAGSPHTRIYLQNIMPVNPTVQGFPQHYDKNAHVVSTNRLLAAVARETKVPLVDLYHLFVNGQGLLDKKYTADGLHLTSTGGGYEKWIALLKHKGYL